MRTLEYIRIGDLGIAAVLSLIIVLLHEVTGWTMLISVCIAISSVATAVLLTKKGE